MKLRPELFGVAERNMIADALLAAGCHKAKGLTRDQVVARLGEWNLECVASALDKYEGTHRDPTLFKLQEKVTNVLLGKVKFV